MHACTDGRWAEMAELGRLLIVEDDRIFAAELVADGARLGLTVKAVHDGTAFERELREWKPTIVATDLVMPGADGLELIRVCVRQEYKGPLILMSGGFELYLKMAEDLAQAHGLRVVAKLTKPFRPKQFSYLLMSLL